MKGKISPLFFALILAAGCSSLLTSSTPPQNYYQIEYDPSKVACAKSFGRAVKVWDFSTSSPYNRPEMVVFEADRRVLYSSAHQWVARPGTLVAESLLRDLDLGSLFPQAVGADSPVVAPLELSGRVLVFGWEKRGPQFKAVFQVEVTLTDTEDGGKLLFRRDYRFESKPFNENSASQFAQAMSGLIKDFSTNFRLDLCATLTGSHGDRRP
ncbi:MAG: ABC-type transport auxiliary lipoprotein family protein [Deltaproteobacteria bacterium]